MEITKGGTILEAEDAKHTVNKKATKLEGFTGSGYLTSNHGHAYVTVEWNYDAPETGEYMLEFRYGMGRQVRLPAYLKVNGELIDGLIFWESGEPQNWVWDRMLVKLKKGNNTIKVAPEGMVNFDHLNVIQLK